MVWQTIKTFYRYIPTLLKVKRKVYGYIDAHKHLNWSVMLIEQLKKHDSKIMLKFEDEVYTAKQMLDHIALITAWAKRLGFKKGDVIGIDMVNGPTMVLLIIALTRLGIICSLLNSEISGPSLLHTMNITNIKTIIVDADGFNRSRDILQNEKKEVVQYHASGSFYNPGALESELMAEFTPDHSILEEVVPLAKKSVSLYIFTSGTTGLSKAVKMSQIKMTVGLLASGMVMKTQNVDENDDLYVCLPLYHATGLVVGLLSAMYLGCSVSVAKRFSVENFFEDVDRYQSTVFMYIGEICRYLINRDERQSDRKHSLRLGIGNGLRPDVWKIFQERFDVKHMIEFYAASEGNFILFNLDNKQGRIGWLHPALFAKNGGALILIDQDTLLPKRNEEGFCIRSASGEDGELIGLIPAKSQAQGHFDGYTDAKMTEDKILRDVFVKGDAYFRTGDILMHDEEGYFHFKDRVGDTYRWKGHNVSTLEVAEYLTGYNGIKEAMVYGVPLKGYDGKVPIAAVLLSDKVDNIDKFVSSLGSSLDLNPSMMPKFIRVVDELKKTSTKKYIKSYLVDQGIDIKLFTDDIYYYDHTENAYVKLDEQSLDKIYAHEIEIR